MKKILLCAGLAQASSLGLGYDQSLMGTKGLSLKYLNDHGLMLQAMGDLVGFGNQVQAYSYNVRLMYQAWNHPKASLYLGVGVGATNNLAGYDLHSVNQRLRDTLMRLSPLDRKVAIPAAAEIPLVFELKLLPALGLTFALGPRYGLYYDHEIGFRGSFAQTTGLVLWYEFGDSSSHSSFF